MTIRLLPNVTADITVDALNDAAQNLENNRRLGSGAALRNYYVQWVQIYYEALRQYIGLAAADELFHSRFYWHSLEMDTEDARAAGLLFNAMTNEAQRARAVAIEMKERMGVLQAKPGWLNVVVDANALALVKPPWEVAWAEMLGVPEFIRLLIPLRVIEEIDRYKYNTKDTRFRETARSLLPQLEERLTEENGTKMTAKDGLTIEVPILPGPRDRAPHADDEILQLCDDIAQFGGQRCALVTDDRSMRIQARARRIRAVEITDKYRRAPEPTAQSSTPPAVPAQSADT